MGERDADVGREPADLERHSAGGGEEKVAAHCLDSMFGPWSEESLELDVAADGDHPQLVEARGKGRDVTAHRVHVEADRGVAAQADVGRDAAYAQIAPDRMEDEIAGDGAELLGGGEPVRGDVGAHAIEGDVGARRHIGHQGRIDLRAAHAEDADDRANPAGAVLRLGDLEDALRLAHVEADPFEELIGLRVAVGTQLELDANAGDRRVRRAELDVRARDPEREPAARAELVLDLLAPDEGCHQPWAPSPRSASAASSAPISLRARRSRISRRAAGWSSLSAKDSASTTASKSSSATSDWSPNPSALTSASTRPRTVG